MWFWIEKELTPTIFLIASGNVARHLSAVLAAKGCRFFGVYNRT
jgi:hypothetical protein